MKESIVILFFILILVSCDGGRSGSYTPSSDYSQPITYTTSCSSCSGTGLIFNPFDGNYYYCETCDGTGSVMVSSPSFTGNKYVCGNGGCLCRKYEKKSVFNSDCKNCGHAKGDHYGY